MIFIGKPGAGKTVLTATMIHELKKSVNESSSDFSPEVCYYFFSQNFSSRNSPVDAYRAIATQLFEKFNTLEKINNLFALAIGTGVTVQKASGNEITDTISGCLPYLPDLYFVFDAIDECSHSDRLIRQLEEWCASSSLKVVVLSRPDVASLRRRVPKESRIVLGGAQVDADIASYLEMEVGTLVQERLLSEDVDQAGIVSHLVGRAEGMFLWARLIIGYLNGPAMTRAQRLATIMERNTEGLDQLEEMYKRIETRINSMDPHSKSLSSKSLMWVAHVRVSPEELKEALYPGGWDMDPRGVSEQFEHAVIVVCGGLVEKASQPTDCFRYIHLTALEFVRHRASRLLNDTVDPLIPNESVSKALIATRCIYLLQTIPQHPLSGRLGQAASSVTLLSQWPLLRLAADWMVLSLKAITATTSLSSAIPDEVLKMMDQASDFLAKRLSVMVWIEAWYNLRSSTDEPYHSITKHFASLRDDAVDLSARIRNSQNVVDYLSNLRDLTNDLIRLHEAWGSHLKIRAHEIWDDVTVFTKSRFFVSTNAASAQCLAPEMVVEASPGANQTIKPTFSISMSSDDGHQLAVLAIFPSE